MMENKLERLKGIIHPLQSVVVAFSGGVDSTFLLKVCLDTLGKDKVLAVTAESETYPMDEVEGAKKTAEMLGARHRIIHTEELCDERFVSNPPQRCYFCKLELFSKLKQVAEEEGLKHVFDGSNLDDTGDFRPGLEAAKELRIVSPLKEAGLTKKDIRELSRALGLPTWSKPSMACLASRFPYGYKITEEELKMVGEAEKLLRSLGFGQVRVRHHGRLARIEAEGGELEKLASGEIRGKVVEKFKELGYIWISMDLQGYRMGSFNEALDSRDFPKSLNAGPEINGQL